jgi:hypothetical protein
VVGEGAPGAVALSKPVTKYLSNGDRQRCGPSLISLHCFATQVLGDHGIFEKQPHAKCRTYPILSDASVFR